MKSFIIAEAGVNHNGSIQNAKKLIDIAAECGCDAVKFQTFKTENLVIRHAKKAEYQIKNTNPNESQYDMLKKLELSKQAHVELIEYCLNKNILFLSTPFDIESADLLEELGITMFKIPSGEITNKPFLQYIAKKQKPIILSTGMSSLEEVKEALEWIYETGNRKITLLHCTSEYPTREQDVNLNAMITMKNVFNIDVGYSDHTIGIEVPIAAVALGATIIEKHFTLDKSMEGPDHKASLEPNDLREMVFLIRNVEKAMGKGVKMPTDFEKITRNVARKSIVSVTNIKKGEVIKRDMIDIKRPGNGIQPKYLTQVIGKRVNRDINEDEVIRNEDIY